MIYNDLDEWVLEIGALAKNVKNVDVQTFLLDALITENLFLVLTVLLKIK